MRGWKRSIAIIAIRASSCSASPPMTSPGRSRGSNAEIESFCTTNFGVEFPMFEKLVATGPDKHPLYALLTAAAPGAANDGAFRERLKGYGMEPNPAPELLWNFEKFLVGRDGAVIARFSPDTAPDDAALVSAIEAALAD